MEADGRAAIDHRQRGVPGTARRCHWHRGEAGHLAGKLRGTRGSHLSRDFRRYRDAARRQRERHHRHRREGLRECDREECLVEIKDQRRPVHRPGLRWVGQVAVAHRTRRELRGTDRARSDVAALHRVGRELGATDRTAADLCGADGTSGDLGRGDGARGDLCAGDRAIRHVARHDRIADRRDALVRREELRAVHAVIEPHAQAHIGVVEDGAGDGHHVRQRGVAQQHGVKPLGDGERDRRRRLGRGGCHGGVITPIGGGARPVHEGELELAGAVEVHRTDGDAALVVDELGHLRVERGGEQGESGDDCRHEYSDVHINRCAECFRSDGVPAFPSIGAPMAF